MKEKLQKTYFTNYNLLIAENLIYFQTSSLSNLVDNFAERVHYKYKYGHDNKKFETCGIKCKDCECCLEYINVTNAHAAIPATKKCLMKN